MSGDGEDFGKEKRLIASVSGFCRLFQAQILEAGNRDEMSKIQKQHAENCPQCKGNIFFISVKPDPKGGGAE